ncbi:MAG: NUDIX hydrolase [Romboutsia sp.]
MNWIEQIKSYAPYNYQETKDKELILECISNYPNILTRDNVICHITSSGYIVNKSRDKVLMIYHNIYKSWSWTGGHADGDLDLLEVAIKEAKEETGLVNVKPINTDILSLDSLTVQGHYKKDKYVSSHLHLSVAYLLEADEKDELIVNEDETSGVKWIGMDEISKFCSEPYMIEVYNKFNEKIKAL